MTDTERLDWIEANSFDLRCENVPTGGGDYDILWRVVEHWMSEPKEIIIASGKTLREAIDRAMAEEKK